MAATTDHTRRDAEHAARNEISTVLGKFSRRMNEAAKAHIAENLSALTEGEVVGFEYGTEAGRKAASAAIREYLFDNPEQVTDRPAIESS